MRDTPPAFACGWAVAFVLSVFFTYIVGVSSVFVHGTAKRKTYWRGSGLRAWLLMLPALALSIFVMGGPIVGTFVISLTDWNGFTAPNFIGFLNYASLVKDSNFWMAAVDNVKWMIYFITVPILFALVASVVVSKVLKGQMFFRTAFFLPYIVPSVVCAKIWSLIYNPIYGIDIQLKDIGLPAPLFLGNEHFALFSVAFVDSWRYWAFLMLLFLTALQQADKTLEEAAEIDGANSVQRFFHVIIPQVRPTLFFMFMQTAIWSFMTFDFVYLMTDGGPGHATELISTYMYRLAMNNQMQGYASAISFTMAIFSVLYMVLFSTLRKRGWDL